VCVRASLCVWEGGRAKGAGGEEREVRVSVGEVVACVFVSAL